MAMNWGTACTAGSIPALPLLMWWSATKSGLTAGTSSGLSPRKTLFRLLKQGYDAWEIAEQLDTTEEYVRRAYYYYKENP